MPWRSTSRASSPSSAWRPGPRTTGACWPCCASSEGNPRADEGPFAPRRGHLERTVERADAVLETAQPAPAVDRGAADTVVAHLDHRAAVLAPHVDAGVRRLRVLGDVRERLGDHEVGGGLDRDRQ